MRHIKPTHSARRWQKKKRRRHISFDFGFLFRFLKRLATKRIALTALVLLVLGSVFYVFLFSGYFAIRDIEVAGAQSLSADEVKQAVRAGMDGKRFGFLPGNHLLFTDTKALGEKLHKDFPEINELRLSKKIPAGLAINLTEKNPALIWCRSNCYFVSEQGIAYLPANTEEDDSGKRYIKITEEPDIVEEAESTPQAADDAAAGGEESALIPNEAAKSEETEEKSFALDANEGEVLAARSAASEEAIAAPAAISPGEQVSDGEFIGFALDINGRIGNNQQLKIKYYKTKGTKTREIIAYTDKNTRIYFDATQSAEKQTDNLNFFLEKGIEQGTVDTLRYIYLKNNDRVFYR